MIEALRSSNEDWQKRAAASFATVVPKSAFGWRKTRWLAAAAAILLAGGISWWVSYRSSAPPLDLLATAYTRQRLVELRVPGAAHSAPLERGNKRESPPELAIARKEIDDYLRKAPEDVRWLHAKGRAAVLSYNYADAIDDLKKARSLEDGKDPRFHAQLLLDLATAYFEQGQSTNNTNDYSMAADLLGQAIQSDPSLAVAYFNRALVFESLTFYPLAKEDWERYLKLDPSGAWSDEARSHLREVTKKKEKAELDNPGRLRALPEYRFEQALSGGLTGNLTDLAAELSRQHGDRWLEDAQHSADRGALAKLARLVVTRNNGRIDVYPAELEMISQLPSRAPAAELVWREFERLYRVERTPNATACIPNLDSLTRMAKDRRYIWFETQLLLEGSTCALVNGRVADADRLTEEAIKTAGDHEFADLRLRALGYKSSRLVQARHYREAAGLARDALQLFWSKPFYYLRGQQFYTDMMWTSEGLKRWHTAVAASRMSCDLAQRAGVWATEAVNRARWSAYAQQAGFPKEAVEQARQASSLFTRLARNPATDQYRAFAAAQAAESSGKNDDLARLRMEAPTWTNPLVAVPYWRALAKLDEQHGDMALAGNELQKAIGALGPALSSATSSNMRRWELELSLSYRQLVANDIRRNLPMSGYRHWQEYLASLSAIHGEMPLTLAETVSPAVLLTYARLGERYALWVRRESQVDFSWIDLDAGSVDRLVTRYLVLCSGASSSAEALNGAGSRLRSVLLPRLDPSIHAILIQADGRLSSLPWLSLPSPSGQPLVEEFAVAEVPGAVPESSPAGMPELEVRSAVVVAATAVDAGKREDYLPLPGLRIEAEAVGEAFPGTRLIEGAAATAREIEDSATGSDVLHFAGHAEVAPDTVRLLVAPNPSDPDPDRAHGLWRPRLSGKGIQLAVLSACSTARYEEQESPEPYQLAHALLFDGAHQVVGTRWNANSASTIAFMRTFYTNLRANREPAEALRAAALAIRHNPQWAHPYFWAPFSIFVRI